MGLNDNAWEALFQKYHILDEINRNGIYIISAGRIEEYREPRLMTKFDHKVNLPGIFSDNGLSILPVSRGDYIISSFSAYKELEPPSAEMKRVTVPPRFQSLLPEFIVSESIALNCAGACGILADFLDDGGISPTVSGRMGSGNFSFGIDTAFGTKSIDVSNAQIEIDAAYEGISNLSLFEAKRDISDDFLIRQLYYPYRVWRDRVSKPVKSVFLVYSNGVFYLYEYRFRDPDNYNSLYLFRQKNYVISADITKADILSLVSAAKILPEPEMPFPQADNFSRVVNLIELLNGRELSRDDITCKYAFDARQTNYYTDAGRYLGFIEKNRIGGRVSFSLTRQGKKLMAAGYRERQLAIAFAILSHRAFNRVMRVWLEHREIPDRMTVVEIMRRSELFRVGSESTLYRRSSTVISWLNWIYMLLSH